MNKEKPKPEIEEIMGKGTDKRLELRIVLNRVRKGRRSSKNENIF